MSHKLKLGTFQKYEESTKQPNTTSWTEYDIVFKDGSDVVNPTITLAADLSTVQAYNYGYMLGRYYWVVEKRAYRTGVCQLRLETDVLATYKSEIGSSSLYVLRSSAAYDGDIVDRFYPQTAKRSVSAVVMDDYPYTSYSGGKYVIAVAGDNTGASTLYQLSPADFTTLIKQLLGTIDSYTAADVIEAIKNTLFEPMRFINSVMWFPESFPTSSTETVKIGRWSSGVTAGVISNTVKSLYHKSITLPKHPQAAGRGAYLNLAPFSQYILEFDPFGAISLDTSQLAKVSSIDVDVYVDAMTGQGILKVRGSGGSDATGCLASITTQLGVQVPITVAGLTGGAVSGIASVAGGIAAFAAGGGAAALIGAAAAGIDTAASAITGAVSSMGSAGSVASNQLTKVLSAVFYYVVDEDNTRNGRPYCKVTTPSSLTGFMIVSRGDVDIPGTLPEERKIKTFLETGFFYE